MYRLPDGILASDQKLYIAQWQALGARVAELISSPVEKFHMFGFDSSLSFATQIGPTVQLGAHVAINLVRNVDGKLPWEKEGDCPCGSANTSWWAKDAQGIELCRVCPSCETDKLAKYRPEIISGYDQSDVSEPIEPEA